MHDNGSCHWVARGGMACTIRVWLTRLWPETTFATQVGNSWHALDELVNFNNALPFFQRPSRTPSAHPLPPCVLTAPQRCTCNCRTWCCLFAATRLRLVMTPWRLHVWCFNSWYCFANRWFTCAPLRQPQVHLYVFHVHVGPHCRPRFHCLSMCV